MHRGFVKIHRKIVDWQWYQDKTVLVTWLEIILKANHKPKMVGNTLVERGQLMTSYGKLSERIGLSEMQIRRAFDCLRATGEITCKRTGNNTIVTVCNYEDYNDQELIEQQVKQHADELANNRQTTTTKNVKKEKKKDSPRFDENSFEFKAAVMTYNSVVALNEKTKAPNLQHWALNIDMMKRVDGNTEDDIKKVCQWLFTAKDSQAVFWRGQIRSTANLRKHFTVLWGHYKKSGGKAKTTDGYQSDYVRPDKPFEEFNEQEYNAYMADRAEYGKFIKG